MEKNYTFKSEFPSKKSQVWLGFHLYFISLMCGKLMRNCRPKHWLAFVWKTHV